MTDVGLFKKNKQGMITVYNWNGVPSPFVHQYDRFSDAYFKGTQGPGVLTAFDNV